MSPLKDSKTPMQRAAHTTVMVCNNKNHLDEKKPVKILELRQTKPKIVNQLELYQTRKCKPGKQLFNV